MTDTSKHGALLRTLVGDVLENPAVAEALLIGFLDALSKHYPGEVVRLQGEKIRRTKRIARDQRIAAAVASGDAPSAIARRENVSERHVFRIKARRRSLTTAA